MNLPAIVDWDKPAFTHSSVLAATCLSFHDLQNWVKRGFLNPFGKPTFNTHPGYGRHRLYSARDVVWFALMGRLSELGFSISDGGQICRNVFDKWGIDFMPTWVLLSRRAGAGMTIMAVRDAAAIGRPELGPEADEAWLLLPVKRIAQVVLGRLQRFSEEEVHMVGETEATT